MAGGGECGAKVTWHLNHFMYSHIPWVRRCLLYLIMKYVNREEGKKFTEVK